ncbi:MAG: outer membrane protein assembly factor, partial [Muribaculaceae bacterium]|nr:outer membrane protein assembly factor [Muribaculaceae bacterium]
HVPDDELLLDKVSIHISDNDTIASEELVNYLRQAPNHKVLGFAKLQLGLYNLSGKDGSKWYNKWLRRIGQPPVIYDSELTEASRRQLTTAMVNRGFMDAEVTVDTVVKRNKKKIELAYNITVGDPHTISSVTVETDDPRIEKIIEKEAAPINIVPGMMFDRNVLDAERARIATVMRNNGYYSFSKESITFTADTAAGSTEIDLTMTVRPPHTVRLSTGEEVGPTEHQRYAIKNVIFVTDYDGRSSGLNLDFPDTDTVRYKGITILYGPDRYLRPSILEEKCFIRAGELYNASDVDRTYSALSRLGILRFINIEMKPLATIDGTTWMDAYILLSRNQKQSVSVQVEGT